MSLHLKSFILNAGVLDKCQAYIDSYITIPQWFNVLLFRPYKEMHQPCSCLYNTCVCVCVCECANVDLVCYTNVMLLKLRRTNQQICQSYQLRANLPNVGKLAKLMHALGFIQKSKHIASEFRATVWQLFLSILTQSFTELVSAIMHFDQTKHKQNKFFFSYTFALYAFKQIF